MADSVLINPKSQLITDPIRNFRFLVQFSPYNTTGAGKVTHSPQLGFMNVSGFGMTTEPIQYREGGYNTTVHQLPGQTSFEPINFSRGQTLGGSQNRDWMRQLFAITQGTSNQPVGDDFRCTIDVSVLSHPNPGTTSSQTGGSVANALDLHTSMRFRIYNAWIANLSYGDLSASAATGLMIEGMTIVHEGFDVIFANDFSATAGQFSY
jgi:phage tail-like protein